VPNRLFRHPDIETMDPQQQVINALVESAVTIATDAGTSAMKAAYQKVKQLISKKFGSAGETLERLEKEPEADHLKEEVVDDVNQFEMEKDDEFMSALQVLIEELKNRPEGFAADGGVQLNVSGSDHVFSGTGDINIGGDFIARRSDSSD